MTRGCNWTGPHFGGKYDDAICGEGFLWDADSCEDPHGPLRAGGDIPCPRCNTRAYIEYFDEQNYRGNSRQRRCARREYRRKIMARIQELVGKA